MTDSKPHPHGEPYDWPEPTWRRIVDRATCVVVSPPDIPIPPMSVESVTLPPVKK